VWREEKTIRGEGRDHGERGGGGGEDKKGNEEIRR